MSTLIILNEEMEDIMMKESKEQKGGFLSIGYIIGYIRCKSIRKFVSKQWSIRAGEGTIKAGQDS